MDHSGHRKALLVPSMKGEPCYLIPGGDTLPGLCSGITWACADCDPERFARVQGSLSGSSTGRQTPDCPCASGLPGLPSCNAIRLSSLDVVPHFVTLQGLPACAIVSKDLWGHSSQFMALLRPSSQELHFPANAFLLGGHMGRGSPLGSGWFDPQQTLAAAWRQFQCPNWGRASSE